MTDPGEVACFTIGGAALAIVMGIRRWLGKPDDRVRSNAVRRRKAKRRRRGR